MKTTMMSFAWGLGLIFGTSACLVPEDRGANSAEIAAVSRHGPVVSTAQFRAQVLDSNTPVLVEFWMVGCLYCAQYSTTLSDFSTVYGSRLPVVTIDVHANPELAAQYDTYAMPTTLFFLGGQVVDQAVGAVSLDRLERTADHLIR